MAVPPSDRGAPPDSTSGTGEVRLRVWPAGGRVPAGVAVASAVEALSGVRSSPPSGPWTRASLAGGVAEVSSPNGAGSLSAAVALVLDAQREGETVAWVSAGAGIFFPPDVVAAGVDATLLPVVRARGAVEALRAADILLRSGGFGLVVVDISSTDGDGDDAGAARRPPFLPAGGPRPGEWECGERPPGGVAFGGGGAAGGGGSPPLLAGRGAGARAGGSSPRGRRFGFAWTPSVIARLAGLARRHGAAVLCVRGSGVGGAGAGSMATLRAEAVLRRIGEGHFRLRLRALRDRRRPAGWVHEFDLRGPEGFR